MSLGQVSVGFHRQCVCGRMSATLQSALGTTKVQKSLLPDDESTGNLTSYLAVILTVPIYYISIVPLHLRVSTGLTRFWTIHILCSRRSSTAARILGRIPLTHSCISHNNVTNVPERPTPALKDTIDKALTRNSSCFTQSDDSTGWILMWLQFSKWRLSKMFADCEGDGLKVRPAVHHSRSEARSGFQVLPYVFSENAEWRWFFRDAAIRPGWVVVVGDYPVCRAVTLKHKHFNWSGNKDSCWLGQCTQEPTDGV